MKKKLLAGLFTGLFMFGIAITHVNAATFTFSGTITNVLIDSGSGTYSGTAVGDSFSGNFLYGDNAAQAWDIHTEPNERNWEFEGGVFGASITDGVTPTNFSIVNINIQNNWPLDADSVNFLNTLFGQNVLVGSPIDTWSSGGITDGAFWIDAPTPGDPDNENLANGMIMEVAFVSYDTTLYSGLDYQPLPPGTADLALFLIEEADADGNTLFSAVGLLDTGPVLRAVINTVEAGKINAVWKKGGEDTTSRGDRVIWGYFYASPNDVSWGSSNNPDLFVKIWFDVSGRVDVNYFHVSVPDIEVYSDYPYDGTPDEQGTTTMSRRYIRQYYENGQSYSEENYEDGNPPSGYSPVGNPSGYSTINNLRIGSIINTVEKGPIDAVWRFGGQDNTSRGDQVVWGHFYASPSDVTWGSQDNPDLFVKIWFDVSGRVDVNFFHVSVPDIEVCSDFPDDGTYDQRGTTIMDNRYIRHEYWR